MILMNENLARVTDRLMKGVGGDYDFSVGGAGRRTLLSNDRDRLAILYAASAEVYRGVRKPVEDALRGGLTLKTPELTQQQQNTLADQIDRLRLYEVVKDAFTWMRLFGGAAILINARQNPILPLDNINIGHTLDFHDIDRFSLKLNPDTPNTYTINNTYTLHTSKIVRLHGRRAPKCLEHLLSGWGLSEVEHALRNLNIYNKSQDVLFDMIDEAKLDIFAIDGLSSSFVKNPDVSDKIVKRIELANMLKSYKNALVMDKNDDFKQKEINLSGITDSSKNARIDLASSFGFGNDMFWGLGSNAFGGGQDTIENYNAFVESSIRAPMTRILNILLKLVIRSLFKKDYKFEIKFKPLRMMSSKDETLIESERIKIYIELLEKGILSKEEVLDRLVSEGLI